VLETTMVKQTRTNIMQWLGLTVESGTITAGKENVFQNTCDEVVRLSTGLKHISILKCNIIS
jgi:hypothetical protein